MIKTLAVSIALAGFASAAPTTAVEATAAADPKHGQELFENLLQVYQTLDPDNEADKADEEAGNRRQLFPLTTVGAKCAKRGCTSRDRAAQLARVMMSVNGESTKSPVKALEMLALNDDLNTVVSSDSFCTRRKAMARAAGLAAGMALARVNAPAFAAETKTVKMGSDSGQLVFVPDEVKICKGDSVTWVINKGGPHNVVFDEDNIPDGVSQESISMDGQLGDEGDKYSKKFDTAGSYKYYCEPHRGAGMAAELTVE
jgi:plastocyanin